MTDLRARLTGLLGTLALLGLLLGGPALLLRAGPAFLSRAQLPARWTWDAAWSILTRPDDGTLFVLILVVAAWTAWAVMALLVVVEVAAAVQGVQPPHLAGLPQASVRRLVAAAMLLFISAPHLPTASAVAAPTETVSTLAPPEAPVRQQSATRTAARPTTLTHVVARGETLWSIAQTKLGEGTRYTEIVALNHELLGGRPDFLQPGWRLTLPTPAAGEPDEDATYTVVAGDTLSEIAAEQLGDAQQYPAIVAASRHIDQPGGRRLVDPDVIDVGWTLILPGDEPSAATPEASESPQARRAQPEPEVESDVEPPTRVEVPPETVPSRPAAPSAPGAQRASSAPAAPAPAAADPVEADDDIFTPAWQVASLTGAGAVLASSLWLALRRRRAAQFRFRRPGRMIAGTDPALLGIEKTLVTVGRAAAPTTQHMDIALRLLAQTTAIAGGAMPPLDAVQLTETHLVLHLADASAGPAPEPWTASEDGRRWLLAADVELDTAALDPDLPAPYPQLVTWGHAADGSVWLANLEQAGLLTLAGPDETAANFARYVIAELAVNFWSVDVLVRYAHLGAGVAQLDERRVHAYEPNRFDEAAGDVLAGGLLTLDRAADAAQTVGPFDQATARAYLHGEEVWDSRLLVCAAGDTPALAELINLITTQPATTTACAVLGLPGVSLPGGWTVTLDANRTLRVDVDAIPTLTCVELPEDDANGCALLLAQADDRTDIEIPPLVDDTRPSTDLAGKLHPDLTVPRDVASLEPAISLLPGPDDAYLRVAATTADDLAVLAPQVPDHVSRAVADADPTLDDDLAAWFDDHCPLPRLTVLGPVALRVAATGSRTAAQGRRPQLLDMLAFLTTRPHGATTAEMSQAINTPEQRVPKNMSILREWIGKNPRTGRPHVPDARHTHAASLRGQSTYQVEDLLVDADLFRRLRTRAQTRGTHGLDDLELALSLVTGRPYDQLRSEGGTWLLEGDRHDHILEAAIVDAAHLVAVGRLQQGDIEAARAAAETAQRAVPHDEISQLDLVACLTAEGKHAAAEQHLRETVRNRSDDDLPSPTERPERTDDLIIEHAWFTRTKRSVG